MSKVRIPDYFERYKFYSVEDASIEIQNETQYSTEEAMEFVKSLGYEIRGNHNEVAFDSMFGDWRGSINVVVEEAKADAEG
ncbi:hypothetical protein [Acinetobacter sp.]|uniref:hypothetical protein n=1 Tax=Acinetobacter sp. TaxID=472 RepID=UPI0031CF09E1